MKIQSLPQLTAPRSPHRSSQPPSTSLPQDSLQLSKDPQPTPPPPEKGPGWGPQILGGLAGALVGILAGHAGPAGVALAAGAGAAAVTFGATAPLFKDSLENGTTGNPMYDMILVCGTVAAGGMLLATTGAAAAGLAYPTALGLSRVAPLAAPLLGGAIGASVGSYFGIEN